MTIRIPNVEFPPFGWKEKFFLKDEKVLTVQEFITYDSDGKIADRAFSYDFRDKGSSDPIFRVCNHNEKLPADAPCHVHVGSDANSIECFPTAIGRDLPYAIHCIKNFYLGKPQDWEKGESDESNGESSAL